MYSDSFVCSLNIKELNLESQCRVWRNETWKSLSAICVIRRTSQSCLWAFLHLNESFIPSFDDLANSDLAFEWLVSLNRWIKHSSIRKSSMVVSNDCLTLCWLWSITFMSDFDFVFRHFIFVLFELINYNSIQPKSL